MIPSFSRAASGGGAVVGAPGTPATTPDTIFGANLIAHFHTKTGVTHSSGAVTTWADQSGNGLDLTVGALVSPLYVPQGLNTAPTIRFQTPAQGLATGSFAGAISSAAAFFMVARIQVIQSQTANVRVLSFVAGGDTAGDGMLFYFPTPTGGAKVFQSTAIDTLPYDTAKVAASGIVFDGANLTYYLNNAAIKAEASTLAFNSANLLRLGNNGNAGSLMDVKEIVVLDVAPSAGDRALLQAYFEEMWGTNAFY